MSCYIRHLGFLMDELHLENTKENRKKLDLRIRKALEMEDKHCPEIWSKVNNIVNDNSRMQEFLKKLK